MAERPLQDQLVTQLKYAMRRERLSQARYLESAKLARVPELQRLLLKLAAEEAVHEVRLHAWIERLGRGTATAGD
jgi:rubrerythrin